MKDQAAIHDFMLLHVPCGTARPGFTDPVYDSIKARPPAGCVPQDIDGIFSLQCRRSAPTLLNAVADVCREVHTQHGILLTDLGLEKLWEWSSDGPSGFGATVVCQLLLMAAERASTLGYSADDLVDFLAVATTHNARPTG